MRIVYPVAATVELAAIPATVEIDAPSRLHLGRVDWHCAFRFEVAGREYWGTVDAHGEGDLYTRNESTGFGRRLPEGAKAAWREAIAKAAAPVIREGKRAWFEAFEAACDNGYTMPRNTADSSVREHFKAKAAKQPEAPAIEAPAKQPCGVVLKGTESREGETRAHTWNELTGAEQSEATLRGFSRERGTVYFLRSEAKAGDWLLSRWSRA